LGTAKNARETYLTEMIQKLNSASFSDSHSLPKDRAFPRISIVTPSFNQVRFLERTIKSVLDQGYPNLELIIIDGGSKDGSVDIIKQYQNNISYWVSEPDKGQADAINKGFRIATGELVSWQNSDDIYLPGALRRVAHEYRINPDYHVYFGNIYLIDSSDRVLREMRFHPFRVGHLLFYDWNLSSQGTFFRRDVFESAGYLQNTAVCFDREWFIRLGKKGFKFRFIRQFVGAYRIHEDSKLFRIKDRENIRREILGHYGIRYDSDKDFIKRHRIKRAYYGLEKLVCHLYQGDFGYIAYIIKSRLRKKRAKK